jgi:hypothetical protein
MECVRDAGRHCPAAGGIKPEYEKNCRRAVFFVALQLRIGFFPLRVERLHPGVHIHPVDLLQPVSGEDRCGRAESCTLSMVEQKNPVGILSGKREIVHDTQNCFGRLPAPAVDQRENVFLIEEIQMIGGLVQQKDIRILSEHLGQESALEFAGDSTFVYVKGEDGAYSRTSVKTGLSDGLRIEIKEGLSLGQTVRGNQIFDEKKKK